MLGLWKDIGFGFFEEACPRRVLHPDYTMEGVNLAPMKEEKRLTFHSPVLGTLLEAAPPLASRRRKKSFDQNALNSLRSRQWARLW